MPKYNDYYDVDVVVVGAGLSGLYAAYTLLQKDPGLTVIIIEATERIGGRICSVPLLVGNGKQFKTYDLGGHWVSQEHSHLANLVKTFNLVFSMPDECSLSDRIICEMKNGKIVCNRRNPPTVGNVVDSGMFNHFFSQLDTYVKNLSVGNATEQVTMYILDKMTMEFFIVGTIEDETARDIVRNVIRATCGADCSATSVLFYIIQCNGTTGIAKQLMTTSGGWRHMWINGGSEQLVSNMAKIIQQENILTDEVVVKVDNYEDCACVVTDWDRYVCRYVVMTVPPNQLLAVEFDPPLPKNRIVLMKNMSTNHCTKFVVTYREAFWKDKGFTGDFINCGTTGPVVMCYDITLPGKPALTGYIFDRGSNSSHSYESASSTTNIREAHKNKVLKQLSKYFGEAALSPLEYIEKSWWQEKYAGGCPMCCPPVGHMPVFMYMHDSIGRIHWGGAESSTNWRGFMEGALIAGHRAAIEVLAEIRPSALTRQDLTVLEPEKRKKFLPYHRSMFACFKDWRILVPLTLLSLFVLRKLRQDKHYLGHLYDKIKSIYGNVLNRVRKSS